MRIVGVDPGRKGALAFIRGGVVCDVIDVPLMPDNSQVQVDGKALCKWIESVLPLDVVVIENVQPMRGTGDDSEGMPAGNSFRFGMIAGELRMAFKCYGVPIVLVVPTVWKRHFGLLKQRKAASKARAHALKPGAARLMGRPDRAEAVLLALYENERRGML